MMYPLVLVGVKRVREFASSRGPKSLLVELANRLKVTLPTYRVTHGVDKQKWVGFVTFHGREYEGVPAENVIKAQREAARRDVVLLSTEVGFALLSHFEDPCSHRENLGYINFGENTYLCQYVFSPL